MGHSNPDEWFKINSASTDTVLHTATCDVSLWIRGDNFDCGSDSGRFRLPRFCLL